MGNLLREYWIPALPSTEFPAPDSPPKRMRLLGENLVMFRDTNGNIGAFKESCPHRGASLFFGRNEEAGLRCVYHGWKFDVSGACVDMPSEPAESNFKSKVRIGAYPARDVNHMVWVYMGPREVPPPFPQFEVNLLPPENVSQPSIMMEEANWVQNLEGDLDSNHLDYLHSRISKDAPLPPIGGSVWYDDKLPRLDVRPTEYGVFYSARRTWPENKVFEHHRINQFIFPFHTMITGGNRVNLRSFVPLDDEWAMLISQSGSLTEQITQAERERNADSFAPVGGYVERTSDPRTYFYTKANKYNDYGLDYELQKTSLFCGIPFVGNLQDRAMTELMTGEHGEVIYDRSHEHLGTLDIMVITVRRQLLRAVKAYRDEGILPPNIDNAEMDRVRHATVILPKDADWVQITERIRDGHAGLPVAHEMKPLTETPLAIEAAGGA
jgi:phthalate 4,5-dioxygenase